MRYPITDNRALKEEFTLIRTLNESRYEYNFFTALFNEEKISAPGFSCASEVVRRFTSIVKKILPDQDCSGFFSFVQREYDRLSIESQELKALNQLTYFLNTSSDISHSKQQLQYLYEEHTNCHHGFFNRVSEIVSSYFVPKNLEELIYNGRKEIIDKLANRSVDTTDGQSVHGKNRLKKIIHQAGIYNDYRQGDGYDSQHGRFSVSYESIKELKDGFDPNEFIDAILDRFKGMFKLKFKEGDRIVKVVCEEYDDRSHMSQTETKHTETDKNVIEENYKNPVTIARCMGILNWLAKMDFCKIEPIPESDIKSEQTKKPQGAEAKTSDEASYGKDDVLKALSSINANKYIKSIISLPALDGSKLSQGGIVKAIEAFGDPEKNNQKVIDDLIKKLSEDKENSEQCFSNVKCDPFYAGCNPVITDGKLLGSYFKSKVAYTTYSSLGDDYSIMEIEMSVNWDYVRKLFIEQMYNKSYIKKVCHNTLWSTNKLVSDSNFACDLGLSYVDTLESDKLNEIASRANQLNKEAVNAIAKRASCLNILSINILSKKSGLLEQESLDALAKQVAKITLVDAMYYMANRYLALGVEPCNVPPVFIDRLRSFTVTFEGQSIGLLEAAILKNEVDNARALLKLFDLDDVPEEYRLAHMAVHGELAKGKYFDSLYVNENLLTTDDINEIAKRASCLNILSINILAKKVDLLEQESLDALAKQVAILPKKVAKITLADDMCRMAKIHDAMYCMARRYVDLGVDPRKVPSVFIDRLRSVTVDINEIAKRASCLNIFSINILSKKVDLLEQESLDALAKQVAILANQVAKITLADDMHPMAKIHDAMYCMARRYVDLGVDPRKVPSVFISRLLSIEVTSEECQGMSLLEAAILKNEVDNARALLNLFDIKDVPNEYRLASVAVHGSIKILQDTDLHQYSLYTYKNIDLLTTDDINEIAMRASDLNLHSINILAKKVDLLEQESLDALGKQVAILAKQVAKITLADDMCLMAKIHDAMYCIAKRYMTLKVEPCNVPTVFIDRLRSFTVTFEGRSIGLLEAAILKNEVDNAREFLKLFDLQNVPEMYWLASVAVHGSIKILTDADLHQYSHYLNENINLLNTDDINEIAKRASCIKFYNIGILANKADLLEQESLDALAEQADKITSADAMYCMAKRYMTLEVEPFNVPPVFIDRLRSVAVIFEGLSIGLLEAAIIKNEIDNARALLKLFDIKDVPEEYKLAHMATHGNLVGVTKEALAHLPANINLLDSSDLNKIAEYAYLLDRPSLVSLAERADEITSVNSMYAMAMRFYSLIEQPPIAFVEKINREEIDGTTLLINAVKLQDEAKVDAIIHVFENQNLLRNQVNPRQVNPRGLGIHDNALYWACENVSARGGDMILRSLLQLLENESLINLVYNDDEDTLVDVVISKENQQALEFLLVYDKHLSQKDIENVCNSQLLEILSVDSLNVLGCRSDGITQVALNALAKQAGKITSDDAMYCMAKIHDAMYCIAKRYMTLEVKPYNVPSVFIDRLRSVTVTFEGRSIGLLEAAIIINEIDNARALLKLLDIKDVPEKYMLAHMAVHGNLENATAQELAHLPANINLLDSNALNLIAGKAVLLDSPSLQSLAMRAGEITSVDGMYAMAIGFLNLNIIPPRNFVRKLNDEKIDRDNLLINAVRLQDIVKVNAIIHVFKRYHYINNQFYGVNNCNALHHACKPFKENYGTDILRSLLGSQEACVKWYLEETVNIGGVECSPVGVAIHYGNINALEVLLEFSHLLSEKDIEDICKTSAISARDAILRYLLISLHREGFFSSRYFTFRGVTLGDIQEIADGEKQKLVVSILRCFHFNKRRGLKRRFELHRPIVKKLAIEAEFKEVEHIIDNWEKSYHDINSLWIRGGDARKSLEKEERVFGFFSVKRVQVLDMHLKERFLSGSL